MATDEELCLETSHLLPINCSELSITFQLVSSSHTLVASIHINS